MYKHYNYLQTSNTNKFTSIKVIKPQMYRRKIIKNAELIKA